jgi:hypothetical protein
MAKQPTNTQRLTGLEKDRAEMRRAILDLAKAQAQTTRGMTKLDNAMAHLAEVQAETTKEIRELGKETDRRLRELGEETDRRIAALVSAIGELIRRDRPQL